MKITTDSGYTCEVKEDAMNDMRILDALTKVESRKTDAATKVIKLIDILDALLGEEQKDDLYDFVVAKEGQAKTEAVFGIIKEIFEAVGDNKKK